MNYRNKVSTGLETTQQLTKGFTLVELLVVLIILGLVASIAGPNVMKYLGSSKGKTAKLQIKEIESALELYFLDTGQYPSNDQGLKMLIKDEASVVGWNGPYFKHGQLPQDPWGQNYVYVMPGEHATFDLMSLGADSQPGGEGDNKDITNWQR
jgi:general secretion pathway protein G